MSAICWLRGWVEPRVVAAEYQELVFYYKTSVEQARSTKENSTGVFSSFVWIKHPSVYRPLRLATVYYTITLISCLTPCRPYVVDLMKESGVNDTRNVTLVGPRNRRPPFPHSCSRALFSRCSSARCNCPEAWCSRSR